MLRERRFEPAPDPGPDEIVERRLGIDCEFAPLTLADGARTQRDVLARHHRRRASEQPGHGHAEGQTRRRHDVVLGAHHGGAQPALAFGAAQLAVQLGRGPRSAETRFPQSRS